MEKKLELSHKEKVLRVIKASKTKPKVSMPRSPKLKIGGIDSQEFMEKGPEYHSSSKTLKVREALRNIQDGKSNS